MQIAAEGRTDIGNVRKNNEDAYLVRIGLPLFVVADGVGGAAAGEVASQLFVSSCEQEFEAAGESPSDLSALIERCFQIGNRKIIDHARSAPETQGMACTAEVLTFSNNEYIIGHVGDSRTYLVRDGMISLVTKDHSFVQEQLDRGLLTEEEAENHRLRNAIHRAVGFEEQIQVDIIRGRVKDGDIFLMCSDGLSDMVSDEDLLALASAKGDVGRRADALVTAAKMGGGRDNITVVLCQVVVQPSLAQKLSQFLGLERVP